MIDREHLRRFESRGADNGNTLGHHELVPRLGMQVARAHEAGLRWMGMDPADDEQIFVDAVIKHGRFVLRVARIRRALLLRDEQARHEQGIVDRSAAQHPA